MPSAASDEDVAWEDSALKAQLEALPRLRTAAEKWAANISVLIGLLGAAALLGGPEHLRALEGAAEDWAGGLVLAGAVGALAANILAVLAALGKPEEVNYPTGAHYREWSREQFKAAKWKLAVSRILTAGALAALVASVILTWRGPTDDRDDSVLVRSKQSIACGTIERVANGALTVTGDSGGATTIPGSEVLSIITVKSCD